MIPVCEQVDVRMAAHPYDPPGLPRGYQGVDNWDAAPDTVLESLKKYEAVVDSHYNGFQLCLGTCGEGCPNPREDILPIVRYLAGKGKIHQIHMRNIRGGLHDFQEVYIDEGDMNFIEVVRILRDAEAGREATCPITPRRIRTIRESTRRIRWPSAISNSLIRAANAEVPA